MQRLAGLPIATEALATAAANTGSRIAAAESASRPRYRAVSWWLTFDDLAWPNSDLHDAIRRRADRCAASGVNCCLVFGAHFRWDFLPLWSRLHDLLRTIAVELHERKILLFDHHSSVLTHRPRNAAEVMNIVRRNRHHVPFYPSHEAAATWEFAGSRLNDWRMLDVETGQPVYLPAYDAEQFCMNHPAFRAAYGQYVQRLVKETGIDGLMSDDGIFYAGWRACSCPHCRERFRRDHGHELPPTTDAGFWGNRSSAAFRDWIEMRFRSSGDFLAGVRATLGPAFPLVTCCSSSDGHALPAYGMSYQDFIRSCDHVLLEMVGSTPSPAGTWDDRIPSQLLHLGLAQEHRLPCFGLAYGFFPDTAFFSWALNKFLGSDCWFSTLKGRLGAAAAQLATLADDSELVGEGFLWERAHPQLFAGQPDTDIAVMFSRATRDFYGQVADDYTSDYHTVCLQLMRAGLTFDVVTTVPRGAQIRRLVLASVVCLSAEERAALGKFLRGGGTVIATGPCGFCDERANPAAEPWLRTLGLAVEWNDPPRVGGFPPYQQLKTPVPLAQCRVTLGSQSAAPDGWHEVAVGQGRLFWHPERFARSKIAPGAITRLPRRPDDPVELHGLPASWRARRFRAGNRWLVHCLPARVGTVLHPTLKNQMGQQPIIERLDFTPLETELTLKAATPLAGVVLHSPDLPQAIPAQRDPLGVWRVKTTGVRRYFILEAFG